VKLTIKKSALQKGFTLIELLVVIGIIAILTAVVAVAVNPGRQFAQARDAQRRADISAIVSAVYQYAADNNGNLPTDIVAAPTAIGTDVGLIDLTQELIGTDATYLSAIPFDPSTGGANNTNYIIFRNGNRITASASAETPNATITITR